MSLAISPSSTERHAHTLDLFGRSGERADIYAFEKPYE